MTTRATRLNWILTGAATAATLLAFGATANAQDADTAQRPNLTSRAERSAERLDRRGNAIENRLDRRGDRANRRLDRRSKRAENAGLDGLAQRLDARGDGKDARLDRLGERANLRLDRKGDRRVSRAERRAGQ